MIRATSTVGSQTTGTPIPLDVNAGFNAVAQCSGTFTATYSVEYTTDNIFDSSVTPTWSATPNGSGKSAAATVIIDHPATAVRLNVTAYTSGSVVMKVLQGSTAAA
jgi:hypothetical protein